jgi:hypothetical protein
VRDILFGGTGPAPELSNLSPETQAVGFDNVTVATFPLATIIGGIGVYGQVVAYVVPSRVDRAELRQLAVHGHPEGVFQSKCWWQLQIEDGATQEVVFSSQVQTNFPTLLSPPITSGFQFGRYGSLQKPQDVFAQLRQGQRLVIPIFGQLGLFNLPPTNLTVYVRARGLIFTGR